jgi:hypothetical protein
MQSFMDQIERTDREGGGSRLRMVKKLDAHAS